MRTKRREKSNQQTVGIRVRILRRAILRGREDSKMTYLIAPLDEILRFLVGPFLSWPFFREVYQLMRWLLLTLFTMWRPVPSGYGRAVPVKP